MQHTSFKQFVLLLGLLLPVAWCWANDSYATEGYDPIPVKETNVQGAPKGSTIHAAINGHLLMVTFTENLGQVAVEVTTASGTPVDGTLTITPNGVQIYIPLAGDYIVTFTLPNGDEYYGEFTVTD